MVHGISLLVVSLKESDLIGRKFLEDLLHLHSIEIYCVVLRKYILFTAKRFVCEPDDLY